LTPAHVLSSINIGLVLRDGRQRRYAGCTVLQTSPRSCMESAHFFHLACSVDKLPLRSLKAHLGRCLCASMRAWSMCVVCAKHPSLFGLSGGSIRCAISVCLYNAFSESILSVLLEHTRKGPPQLQLFSFLSVWRVGNTTHAI
jgi:hypothetical protein